MQIRGLAGIAEREKTVDSPPPPVATEEPPPAKKTRKSATKNAVRSDWQTVTNCSWCTTDRIALYFRSLSP